MSHFYACIQGSQGAVTRCGTKRSGVLVHVRGWNVGVRVHLTHENGKDIVAVYKTKGSNNPYIAQLVTVFTEEGML